MKFSSPRYCPVPGCGHPAMSNPGGYNNHVVSCRRKYIARHRSPQQKIMDAAKYGKGLKLTAHEVARLSADGAIATCAENDDAEETA